MTPTTQDELYVRGRFIRPKDPRATDSGLIVWTREHGAGEAPEQDIDTLLDDYSALAIATPDEVADFIARRGLVEIRGDGAPDWSEHLSGPGQVSAERIREHARGVAAARRLGAALVTRRPGERSDWLDVYTFLRPSNRRPQRPEWLENEVSDWRLGRERFSAQVSGFLVAAGVYTSTNWTDQQRLALVPATNTFVGAIALLLAREIGSEGQYACTSCGAAVVRRRAPREGESVYCDRPECKREQQRRNQARWRARKAAEEGGA